MEIRFISVNNVYPNKQQPRKIFDMEKIEELSQSIEKQGIIQPIVVQKSESGYMIIAGERRYRAARRAGLSEIPCIVRDLDEGSIMEVALLENIQRENLNPVEEALAYKELMEKYSMTQDSIGKLVGKSRPHISNTMRILNLDSRVLEMIMKNEITPGHGKAILRLESKDMQFETAGRVIKDSMSVRKTESHVAGLLKPEKKKRQGAVKDVFIRDAEERLIDRFNTKVKIDHRPKKGKIEIEYYSEEELEELLNVLLKEAN